MITEAKDISSKRGLVTLDGVLTVHVDNCDGQVRWVSNYDLIDQYIESGDFHVIDGKLYFV